MSCSCSEEHQGASTRQKGGSKREPPSMEEEKGSGSKHVLNNAVQSHLAPNRISTGAGNITSHRLREYEVKKLRPPACCSQENAIFAPHIHATAGK